jgi:hypothetical protein
MSAGSSESEVVAQELDSIGSKLLAVETRLADVEKVIQGLRGSRYDYGSCVGGGFLTLGPGLQGDAPPRVTGSSLQVSYAVGTWPCGQEPGRKPEGRQHAWTREAMSLGEQDSTCRASTFVVPSWLRDERHGSKDH